ncbi:polysaccharide biosynthesis protein [Litorivicinus sp.]|nr:polysaccharide biosynthesis protein [Litorivicinus sp.]MDC1240007.1 polysaccharide biosynthesis protein [Litorivicinus sp.]
MKSSRELMQHAMQPVLQMSRKVKQSLVVAVDICLCILATWMAFYLRTGEFVSAGSELIVPVLLSVSLSLPIFSSWGLYRSIFRYSGLPAIIAITQAISVYGLLFATAVMAIGIDNIPRTVGLIQPLILFLCVAGSRLLAPIWFGSFKHSKTRHTSQSRVLIYGAGSAGRQLSQALSGSVEFKMVGYLDDDSRLHGHVLNGLPIYSPNDIDKLRLDSRLTDVLLAIPSVSRSRRNQILRSIASHQLKVRTLPSLIDLAAGTVQISDLRELDIDDLLGRDAVLPNQVLLSKKVNGKIILVTGAAGSIGGELCRQVMALDPKILLLVEISEFGLYTIQSELESIKERFSIGSNVRVIPLLCSVQDRGRVHEIISTWRPDIIYHAAAYKHVPLVEHNLSEGVKNNLFGTLAVVEAAIDCHVSDFVLVSTDKAVRPTNVMGATKRLAEMTLQALSARNDSNTCLSMVRFGNVLASSGSVIPKFREQIRGGGPVTVTHPEVNRFFMTIPEASQLVIQASSLAKGGDVFVLDMDQPIKIIELASRMIRLSGLTVCNELNPDGDIEIEITGLRPGEKLFEELLIGNSPEPTQHPKIMRAKEQFVPWKDLRLDLDVLKHLADDNHVEDAFILMQKMVDGFEPVGQVVDWLHAEQQRNL